MKKIALSLMIVVAATLTALPVAASNETRQEVKVHKKLEGTEVPKK